MNEINYDSEKLVQLVRDKVSLDPWHRRIFYSGFAVTWASGALWIIAQWLKDPDLGPVRTPVQTLAMQIHGAAALFSLLLLGTMLTHVRRGWAVKANRWSGGSMIAVNAALILTAWLLYYSTGDAWREWSSTLHWVFGLAALPLIAVHIRTGRIARADQQEADRFLTLKHTK